MPFSYNKKHLSKYYVCKKLLVNICPPLFSTDNTQAWWCFIASTLAHRHQKM